jgi:dTDP-4-amino-4,6-dideoxygalactose transaminase
MRKQLPAYSPLSLGAVTSALAGLGREPDGLRQSVVTELNQSYQARDALLVGSGTSALTLAIAAARAQFPDRPVALPAYTCYDVATAAEGAGAPVLLYDIDPQTLQPERRSLARVMERRPGAVVITHLYGYPVAVEGVQAACRDAGALFIEDAAQAAGGRLGGRRAGTFGSLTVLSFGRGKGTTAGAGGALLARDDAGARALARVRDQVPAAERGGRGALLLAAQWALGRPALYWLPAAMPWLRLGETVYHPPRATRAMTQSALHALRVSLRDVDSEVARRREHAARLLTRVRRSRRVRVIESVPDAEPGFLRLPLLSDGAPVVDVVRALGDRGVAPGYPVPLHELRAFRDRVVNTADDFAGAARLAARLFTFPTHSLLTERDLRALEDWFSD